MKGMWRWKILSVGCEVPWLKRCFKRAGGFTLLEVVIALAILSISLVVLLGLKNRNIEMASAAQEVTVATALARMMMVQTELEGFPELGEDSGDFSEDYPRFRWRRMISLTPFDYVRESKVWVYWGEGENASVEMVKFIFEKP